VHWKANGVISLAHATKNKKNIKEETKTNAIAH